MEQKKIIETISRLWKSDEACERIAWAVIFFLGATLLLVEISDLAEKIEWYNGWDIFFIGLGSVMVLNAIIRRKALGRRIEGLGAICGLILFGIGFDGMLDFDLIWPVLLVIFGTLILLSALLRSRFDGDVDDWDMPN